MVFQASCPLCGGYVQFYLFAQLQRGTVCYESNGVNWKKQTVWENVGRFRHARHSCSRRLGQAGNAVEEAGDEGRYQWDFSVPLSSSPVEYTG